MTDERWDLRPVRMSEFIKGFVAGACFVLATLLFFYLILGNQREDACAAIVQVITRIRA
jgi:hypothetical protein